MPEYLQRYGRLELDEQRRNTRYTLRLWWTQLCSLLWLRLVSRTRRPFALAADFLVPVFILFVVWFGADMSPWASSPPYLYNETEVRNLISPIPEMMRVPPRPADYVDQTASSVYNALVAASAYLENLSENTVFTNTFLPAIASAGASRLSNLLFSDAAMAAPFQVPSFDTYIDLMGLARTSIARKGLLDAQHISGFIWQAINRPYGKLTFGPNTPQVDAVVRYLLTTSSTFKNHLVPAQPSALTTGVGFGFASEEAASLAAPQPNHWAHVTISALTTGSSINLEYTIAMNETDVPSTTNSLNQFGGGIGASFSQYFFSGFLTLQYEIEAAITAVAQQQAYNAGRYDPMAAYPPGGRLDSVALALSTCKQAVNDTFPSMDATLLHTLAFPYPTAADQIAVVSDLVSSTPAPWIVAPQPLMEYASNIPCLYEAIAFCPTQLEAFTDNPIQAASATLVECLANVTSPSTTCAQAQQFVTTLNGHCFATMSAGCSNMSAGAFLSGSTRAGVDFPGCMLASVDPDCSAEPFGQLVATQTQITNLCHAEVAQWCSSSKSQLDCLKQRWLQYNSFPTKLCEIVVVNANKCVDDIASLCSVAWNGNSMDTFPFGCLHLNVDLLSQSCYDSDLIQLSTKRILGRNATVSTPTRSQHTCRQAHALHSALASGVTAVAFPTDGAEVNSFFRNCGPLIGLVVALSLMYPFTTLTRHIAEERERGQKEYLLLSGTNHSAILTAHFLAGLAVMFLLSLLTAIPIEVFARYTPTHIVYGLTLSYCFSLVGMSMFIASVVNTAKTATIAAPAVLFVTTIPAYVVFGGMTGLDVLFTPSTAAESFNIMISLSSSPHVPVFAATTLYDNGGVMFGMGLVYITLAVIIEYIRISHHSFGFIGRIALRLRALSDGSQKIVFKNFKHSKIYHVLNRSDYTGARSQVNAANELDDQDTDELITAAHLQDVQDVESGLIEERVVADDRRLVGDLPQPGRTPRTAYSIGGVGEGGVTSKGGPSQNNSGPVDQRRSEGSGVSKFVQLVDASIVRTGLHGAHAILRNVTCTLYKNRTNVIVGPAASGKSAILGIIGGATAPNTGACTIDEQSGHYFNRSDMGVALQTTVYWDALSVKEHIELAQRLRGVTNFESKERELAVLADVLELDLADRAELVHLSTGLKRRLSVAMAFAGGARLILLDEPTASVDPVGRRCIWKLIQQNVEDRCIIVATSHAEEADKADHVVLLHRGSLKAAGTPRFVKETLGGATILSLSRGAHCQPATLVARVNTYCPRSRLINNVGQELCFRIDPADFHAIPEVLTELEVEMARNSVKGISIADSRFDELFMRVVREFDAKGEMIAGSDGRPIDNDDLTSSPNTPRGGTQQGSYTLHTGAAPTGSSTAIPAPTESPATRSTTPRPREAAPINADQPPVVDVLLFKQADAIGTVEERSIRLRGVEVHVRNIFTVWSRYVAGSSYRFIVSLITFLFLLISVAAALSIMNIHHTRPDPILLSPARIYMYNMVPLSLDQLEKAFVPATVYYDRNMDPSDDGIDKQSVTLDTTAALSAVAMAAYLKDSAFSHVPNRFGSFVLNGTAMILDNGGSRVPIYSDFLMHNSSSPHALPTFHTLLGILRMQIRTNITSVRILATSAPFLSGSASTTISVDIIHTLAVVLIMVPFTFLPAVLVGRIVRERHSGYLDVVSASFLSRSAVWTGTFIWHFGYMMLFSIMTLSLIVFSDQNLVVGGIEVFGMFVLMMAYSGCVLVSSYVFSLPFRNYVTAQNVATMFHFTAGFTFVLAVNAIDMLPVSPDTEGAKNTAERSANALRVFFPSFAFGDAVVRLTRSKTNRFLPSEVGNHDSNLHTRQEGYHPGMHDVGTAIACLVCSGLAYLAFLLIWDDFFHVAVISSFNTVKNDVNHFLYNYVFRMFVDRAPRSFMWNITQTTADDDESVVAERDRVATYGMEEGIVLDNVWQRFVGSGNVHAVYAVQRASLVIGEGDRIAVVGNNGSGKTSLLNIIAGKTNPAAGRLAFWNASKRDCARLGDVFNFYARSYTGYAGGEKDSYLPDDLTPYFLLHVVADARGIRLPLEREAHIAHLLHTLGILQVGLTRCGQLSPVVKRKVAIGMALVGFPPVVILDEPTTGMDPVGRRQIWAAINLLPSRCALVVSTQHHEDVEMLSNRVVLMDHGKIRLIASTQNNDSSSSSAPANPFADSLPGGDRRPPPRRKPIIALTVTLNVPPKSVRGDEEDFTAKNEVVEFVFSTFPGAALTEDREGRELKFQLNMIDSRQAASSSGGDHKKWGENKRAGEEEGESAPNKDVAAIVPVAGVTVRDVFERMHQKRTEMMISGIKGAPLSGASSPVSREEPAVVGDTSSSGRRFPEPGPQRIGTRSDPDLPSDETYPFEMRVSCSVHLQILSDTLVPMRPSHLGNNHEAQGVERRIENLSCRIPLREGVAHPY